MKTVDIAQAKTSPVLMILTHPYRGVKNLMITLRCLERYTDLDVFKRIYILANASFGEHKAMIERFRAKYPHLVEDVHCSPPGHHPCVAHMQNLVHERHFGDVILKMDDDMFVTPGWLAPLLETWRAYRDDPKLGILTPMVPINTMGAKVLWEFMGREYGNLLKDFWIRGLQISHNEYYHIHVWKEVTEGHMMEKFAAFNTRRLHEATGLGSHTSINCVLYDARMIDKVYPYPVEESTFENGEKKFDESMMVRVLHEDGMKVVMDTASVVHHYAFNPVQDQLAAHVPLERVFEYMTGLGAARPRTAARG